MFTANHIQIGMFLQNSFMAFLATPIDFASFIIMVKVVLWNMHKSIVTDEKEGGETIQTWVNRYPFRSIERNLVDMGDVIWRCFAGLTV